MRSLPQTDPQPLFEQLASLPIPATFSKSLLAGFVCESFPEGHRLYYMVSNWFEEEEDLYPKLAQTEATFRQEFEAVVNKLAEVWGNPAFLSQTLRSSDEESEPSSLEEQLYWQGAIALAYWVRQARLLYLEVEHPDKQAPYFLILGSQAKDGL